MSGKSGVWTYYEGLDNNSAQILINSLKTKNENEVFDRYIIGIDNYSNEDLMNEIDRWIANNEEKIDSYIESNAS